MMQTTSENRNPTPIVAIAASAWGLEALQEFFSQMPADSGFAFVAIQHLAPQHVSVLSQLLGRSTQMPVGEVRDGARAEADHVYVIAPGTMLGIANGRFQVRPADGERHEPIDTFLKALANDLGMLATGIILSGSGTDGTSGLRAIHEAGGLTLAQAPETAAHDAMPRSAIDDGVVRHVLPIRGMPAKLIERAKAVAEGRIARPEVAALPLPSPAEHERLSGELHEAHDQLTTDLDATSRLLKIGALFLREGNMELVLGEIVDAAIAISGADFGNIQVFDRVSGDLKIASHRGFPAWWLEYWDSVQRGHGACGTALERRERVLVEDVERDPIFVGTPALEIQRRAGVRAVQSTPLLSRSGEPIGILSTHFRAPGSLVPRVLRLLDLVARQAADILERAGAEQALKDSEARFRALADVSSEALYRMSPDWSAMRELKSRGFLAPTDATSRSWLERYILPEDRPQVEAVIDRAIRTKSAFELEHRVVRADGSPGWTWSRAVPLTDKTGDIVEWFGAANDVTARKRADLELAEANRRLLEADRRKNEFLAVLSHELRNPLAPIRSCLDLLDHAALGSDQERRAHEVIRRQFDHLARLVDDLLDVTRITSGKISLQREVLDLNELARRTVEDHRDAFVRGGIELTFVAAPAAVHVNGDQTRLAQVIGNLLQNAAKFTPRGRKATVSIDSDPTRAQALVRVTDTGRGIASEILPRLFEPFTQADTTLDRQRGGLGLGLTIAKALVELHGGSISAASDGPRKGASFTIALPRETSVPSPAGGPAPGTTSRKLPQRVLVIEDNVDAAESLRGVLELAGHKTDVAYDGPDGVQRVRAFAPDVVFCDIGLPEMDGYEVARTLRAAPELGRVTLVAVSGYGTPEDVAKAREAGFDLHVTKPVRMDQLEQVLTELATARQVRT